MQNLTITLCNASHTFPFLIRNSTQQNPLLNHLISPPAALLGLAESTDLEFKERTLTLKEDDILILYTDGLTDAKNSDGKAFGRKLTRILRDTKFDLKISEACQKLVANLLSHTKGCQAEDDICIITLKVNTQKKAG